MEGRRGTQDVGFVGRGGRRPLDLYGGSWKGCGRSMPCASRLRFDWMQERDRSGEEPLGVDFDHPAFSRGPVHLSDLTKINSRRSSRKGVVREAFLASFVDGGTTPRRLTDSRAPFADRLFFDGVGFLDQVLIYWLSSTFSSCFRLSLLFFLSVRFLFFFIQNIYICMIKKDGRRRRSRILPWKLNKPLRGGQANRPLTCRKDMDKVNP